MSNTIFYSHYLISLLIYSLAALFPGLSIFSCLRILDDSVFHTTRNLLILFVSPIESLFTWGGRFRVKFLRSFWDLKDLQMIIKGSKKPPNLGISVHKDACPVAELCHRAALLQEKLEPLHDWKVRTFV